MWTIIYFPEENSVEVVPSHWVQKNKCAWPKNDVKKHIIRRTILNSFDFNYYPSRVIKKNIVSLEEASIKLKKAEYTSDLSTAEESFSKKTKKYIIPDPPSYSKKNISTDMLQSFNTDVNNTVNSEPKSISKQVKRKLYDSDKDSGTEAEVYQTSLPFKITNKDIEFSKLDDSSVEVCHTSSRSTLI